VQRRVPIGAKLALTLAAAWIALTTCTIHAAAPEYPTRPIRLIIPFPAGGSIDVCTRAVAEGMRDSLGQTVVIDNRAGAGGRIGAELVARAQPDGYTLLTANGASFSIASAVARKLSYDVLRDFESVVLLAELPGTIAVHPSVPATNLAELIKLAKSRPGKLAFATAGAGSGGHLVGLRLAARAGVELLHVPHKGEAPAVADAAGGHVPIVIAGAVKPQIDAGQLRPLATLGRRRSAQLPDVPTVIEQGYPGIFQASWAGISVPVHTPRVIIDRLNRAANASLELPRVRKVLGDAGYHVVGGSPAAMSEWVRSEIERYRAIVAEFNIRLD
jgi:tripartite-type tricarboxylate transporter receptor subunit TctC